MNKKTSRVIFSTVFFMLMAALLQHMGYNPSTLEWWLGMSIMYLYGLTAGLTITVGDPEK